MLRNVRVNLLSRETFRLREDGAQIGQRVVYSHVNAITAFARFRQSLYLVLLFFHESLICSLFIVTRGWVVFRESSLDVIISISARSVLLSGVKISI